MDRRYFEEILTFMSKTIAEFGFSPVKGESYTFANATKAFRIVYNENSQFCLETADIDEGITMPYKQQSAWLFDENHTAKDTLVIAEDFEDCLLKSLGVVRTATRPGEVSLPGKTAAGKTPNIEGLTNKLLAVYPEFKEKYKTELSANGGFLYLDFYVKTFVPKLRETVQTGGKKQISKIMDMFGKMYYEGDSTVSNVVIGVLVAGVFKDDPAAFDTCCASLTDYPEFVKAGRGILKTVNKKKKYAAIFDEPRA